MSNKTTKNTKEKLKLTPIERKASISLSLLFAVRMLGLFLLTPVFADAAKTLINGDNPILIGLAIGAYGLTQAIMQIPMGIASDRLGRRSIVIFGMVLFIIGGIVCALTDDVKVVAIGRGIQGFGAVSAAITAWVADATRPEVRSRAMAMVGSSIGLSFAASLVLAPWLVELVNLSGLFWVISLLGFVCLLMALLWAPNVPVAGHAMGQSSIFDVLKNSNLLKLNLGVFILHFSLMSLFVVLPSMLIHLGGLSLGQLWYVYLPVILISFVFMVPVVFYVETRYAHREGLLGAVLLTAIALLLMSLGGISFWLLVICLGLFFIGFNILEALQPSMVSRACPPEHKGLALGFFNMSQAFGVAMGGFAGGVIARYLSPAMVFIVAGLCCIVWFFNSRNIQNIVKS